MKGFGVWADEPWPLIETPSQTRDTKEHAAIFIASEMSHAHNCIVRGMNSMYLQAPHVRRAADVTDFLFFCKVWCDWVDHHHRLEEEHMFGAFETLSGSTGCMETNIEQHHAFEQGLHDLRHYVTTASPKSYSSATLLQILDSFAKELHKHLIVEIDTLLALQKTCDSTALLAIFRKAEKAATKMPITEILPLLMGLCDRTYEGGIHSWPPAPWFAPWVVYYFFSWQHDGAWRFCPSTTWSIPRRLEFAK
jgi:hypothetical protein